MSFMFTVSPDFTPDHLSGWYIFNTYLQRQSGYAIHLEMCDTFQQYWLALEKNEIDLVYANPYAASMLVREKGFLPLVKAKGISDETIIAVNAESPVNRIEEFDKNIVIASTVAPGVNLMGMIMLEPANLDEVNTDIITEQSFVLVA